LKNQLLSSLPRQEYERLLTHLEPVALPHGRVLYEMDDTFRHAYFPLSGIVSLLSITEAGGTIEVAMIGNQGIVGLPAVLGIDKVPYRVTVQIQGSGVRIGVDALRGEFNRGGRLRDVLLRYTCMQLTEISQSAVCNHFHTVEQRLSRRLLLIRDSVHLNELPLTQEAISHLLGVPRTNVTMRAGTLQQKGLIRYSRGKIVIVDPRGLEEAACECYRVMKDEPGVHLAA
jgi:CRP-like cAMP-binding protein